MNSNIVKLYAPSPLQIKHNLNGFSNLRQFRGALSILGLFTTVGLLATNCNECAVLYIESIYLFVLKEIMSMSVKPHSNMSKSTF